MARKPKEIKTDPLEVILWKAADKLRKNIDAAEYKHVVLGLIFLKYISDSFESHYELLKASSQALTRKIETSTPLTTFSLSLSLHAGTI